MSRTRRILSFFLPGRRQEAADDGFSLIEVIVALGLLVTVMVTTAGFFTTSLKQSNGQTQAQEAAVLADQQLDYTRSVAGTSLLNGRTQTLVAAAIASPPTGVDLSQDVTSTGNYDTGTPPATTQAVPISMVNKVGGTTYTITTFIDQCYLNAATAPDCKNPNGTPAFTTAYGWLYRITVDVTYSLGGGRTCANNKPCYYVASTLRDPHSDPCFNVNVAFAGCSVSQPTITNISPTTVTTNSSTTVTLTGTNFDPGAAVSLDTGGTTSNVSVVNSTTLTFTLTTDNTAAAVGTRTVKVTNPNGKFAYGTMTITTSAINVNTVTPSPIYTGSTSTLTISGSGFQSGSVVSIPATAGTIVGTPTITPIAITISFAANSGVSAIGTWTATVTNPDGNSDSATFAIAKAPITVTAISPSSMGWGTTRSFTITGTGFNSGAQVTLDGSAVSETWVSSTSMTVALTTDPSVATHTFVVTNPDGGNASKTFTVTVNPITVTSVSPSTMAWGTTRNFTITGTGFNSGAQVTLDGSAVSETWVSSTSLTVALTSDPSVATHTFVVTNPDGGTASKTFTVTVNPITVTTVSPSVTQSAVSTAFTITGTGFLSGAIVKLDGTTVTSTRVSSTSMTLTLSPTAASHTFTVLNPDGGSATGTFTASKSVITNVTPISVAHGSKTITLTGTGFQTGTGNTVKVNGGTAIAVSVTNSTTATFTFTVVTGSHTYTVQVTNRDATLSNVYSWTVNGT